MTTQAAAASRPRVWTTIRMLLAVGVLYLIMMGSTFSSLGVVLPHMIASLRMNWAQAGFGFTLLALAAGTSSMLPALIIKRWNGRVTLAMGVGTMMAAYAAMAMAYNVIIYDIGAVLLGTGFSLIGAIPGLHILSGWEQRRRPLVFGAYLACGGLGGAVWPSVVVGVIGRLGDWRGYWWFMLGLIALVGAVSLAVLRERPVDDPSEAGAANSGDWSLGEALRSPQFYIIGCGIAATYLVASTINAFTISYLALIGVGTAMAVITFSIQSACHAAFPLVMGSIAERVGVKALLIVGLVIQAVGLMALAWGSSPMTLIIFAIGVGGGYGTIFLGTTLSLETYFGRKNFAQIFGVNQFFTTLSVIGPALVGWIADRTGRFDISFIGCAVLLAVVAAGVATLRPPQRRPGFAAASVHEVRLDAPA